MFSFLCSSLVVWRFKHHFDQFYSTGIYEPLSVTPYDIKTSHMYRSRHKNTLLTFGQSNIPHEITYNSQTDIFPKWL